MYRKQFPFNCCTSYRTMLTLLSILTILTMLTIYYYVTDYTE